MCQTFINSVIDQFSAMNGGTRELVMEMFIQSMTRVMAWRSPWVMMNGFEVVVEVPYSVVATCERDLKSVREIVPQVM